MHIPSLSFLYDDFDFEEELYRHLDSELDWSWRNVDDDLNSEGAAADELLRRILDSSSNMWLTTAIEFASYIESTFSSQLSTRRFRTLIDKQGQRADATLRKIGFSQQLHEYIMELLTTSIVIATSERAIIVYVKHLLSILRQFGDIDRMKLRPELLNVVNRMTFTPELVEAQLRKLGFLEFIPALSEIQTKAKKFVEEKFRAYMEHQLKETENIRPSMLNSIQNEIIQEAYIYLSGPTYLDKITNDITRYRYTTGEFVKEALLGLSARIEGLVYETFFIDQNARSKLTFGQLINRLKTNGIIEDEDAWLLRSIKEEGDKSRHNAQYNVSKDQLESNVRYALKFVDRSYLQSFRIPCPAGCQTYSVELRHVFDSKDGPLGLRCTDCQRSLYTPQLAVIPLNTSRASSSCTPVKLQLRF